MYLYNTVIEDPAGIEDTSYGAPVDRTDDLIGALHDLAVHVGQGMWTRDQHGFYDFPAEQYRVLVEQLDEDGEIAKILTALVTREDEEDHFSFVHPAPGT